MALSDVTVLELKILPGQSGGTARASLAKFAFGLMSALGSTRKDLRHD